MYRYFIIICFSFLGCGTKEKNDREIDENASNGIDQTISEQIQYSKLGFTKLSDYAFFSGEISDLVPKENVFPYDLNTPLFSDYAKKKRFIYLPQGKSIGYKEKEVLEFPVGTILIKNFYYSGEQISQANRKILETRLLIHEESGWKALPYIWNDDQTEAFLEITGGKIPITLAGKSTIDYTIPDMNQCKSCHDRGGKMIPIGPSIRQLNRKYEGNPKNINQLTQLQDMNWLRLPKHDLPQMAIWDKPDAGNLNDRARAYLDINCAHCHNELGPAKNSGLNLSVFESDPYKIGVNKKPVAAGRGSAKLKYGIVPNQPEASILLHRMNTIEPSTMMPELGRTIVHKEGIALIREWIKNM